MNGNDRENGKTITGNPVKDNSRIDNKGEENQIKSSSKKFMVKNGTGIKMSEEKIIVDFSDIKHVDTPLQPSNKIKNSFEPHVQVGSEAKKPSSSSTHRSRLSDLRSQVTIVSSRDQHTIFSGTSSDHSSASTVERVCFSVPFSVGNYMATEVLAQGGMSITYLGCSNIDSTQKVVIKIPDITSAKTVEMFRGECKILEVLQHPNIVPILDSGEFSSDGQNYPYMVMKFLDGQSLRQQIKTKGKLTWDEAKKLLNDVASALGYLYINNYCHRDIKPDNIIFDAESQNWILVDFGIAKSLQDNIMLTMTMAGQDSGTWDYMPPEQLDGKAVDIRCDIYALGTVIWEALIGTVPRRGTKLPAAYGVELPQDVDILIGKMVEHDPMNRYQTPGEVLQALHYGAKRVETWKNIKRKAKTILRIALFTVIIAALLVGGWFIGDYFSIATAKSIYEANKESPTITLRKINTFSGKLPFFWGRRYIASIKPKLEKEASREREKMKKEFGQIKIEDPPELEKKDDEELKRSKWHCERFLSKWEKIFDTEETRKIIQYQTALDTILEEKLVADTIEEAKNNTKEKEEAKYKDSVDKCNQVLKHLKLDDTKNNLEEFIEKLRKDWASCALKNIKHLLEKDPCKDKDCLNDYIGAYKKLNWIRSVIGNEKCLVETRNDIENKLWKYYSSEATTACEEHHFKKAKWYIETFKGLNTETHSHDANKALESINEAQEQDEWDDTYETMNKYMTDHAYRPALEVLDCFAQKYPDTQIIDIKQQRKTIANKFAAFIVDKKEDLDSYQENLKDFLEKCPKETESIKTLKRFLCWSIHNTVSSIVYNASIVPQAKNVQLAQIKYSHCSHCEDYQQKYLKQLIDAAMNYVVEDSLSTSYGFQYYYQRPPKDCIKMKPPTIYIVCVTSFKVKFSDDDYSLYRGGSDWDADPLMEITTNTGYKWDSKGPVNRQDFEAIEAIKGKEVVFYLNSEGDDLVFSVRDADNGNLIAKDGPYREVKWKADGFVRSGSRSYTFDSGTKITITWFTI